MLTTLNVAGDGVQQTGFDADVPPGGYVLTVNLGTHALAGAPSGEGVLDVMVGAFLAQDLDLDGVVGVNDFLLLLSAWGPCPSCPEDLDHDGSVGVTDLLDLFTHWGTIL